MGFIEWVTSELCATKLEKVGKGDRGKKWKRTEDVRMKSKCPHVFLPLFQINSLLETQIVWKLRWCFPALLMRGQSAGEFMLGLQLAKVAKRLYFNVDFEPFGAR